MIPRLVTWLLVLVCALLVPLGIVSAWAATMLDDTDAYVETVEPIATDNAVTTTMAAGLSRAALQAVGAPLNTRAEIQAQVRQAAARAVTGPEFPAVWREANRVLHREVVKLLSGDTLPPGQTVQIDLAPLAAQLTGELAKQGVTVDLSTADLTVQMVAPKELEQARTAWQLLETAGYWLPIVAFVLIVITLATARRRLATVGQLAGAVAVTLGISLIALSVAGSLVRDEVNDAGGAIWDALVAGLRSTLIIGLVAALVALAVRIAVGLGMRPRTHQG